MLLNMAACLPRLPLSCMVALLPASYDGMSGKGTNFRKMFDSERRRDEQERWKEQWAGQKASRHSTNQELSQKKETCMTTKGATTLLLGACPCVGGSGQNPPDGFQPHRRGATICVQPHSERPSSVCPRHAVGHKTV